MIAGFAKLRADLSQTTDLQDTPADTLLAPFLEVISSQSATGPITFIALTSINKFLDYNVIGPDSKNIQMVIAQLAFSITHCRFEATDHAEDDAVLLKILNIMELLVCGFGNEYLNDESLCDIIETCLSMACQMKRGDLLRRSAEMTMIKLTEAMFSRLELLESESSAASSDTNLQDHLNLPTQVSEHIVTSTTGETSNLAESSEKSEPSNTEPIDGNIEPKPEDYVSAKSIVTPNSGANYDTSAIPQTPITEHRPFQKYGIPSVREYLRVLISIIDPSNSHQYTDATRIMVLHLIGVSFEVAGSHFGRFPSLIELTTNSLLKNLLQLIRSDNPYLLQKTLRVSSTIFHTTREHLKLQHEFFLTYILSCLSPIAEIPREEGVDDIFYNGVPSIPRSVLNASPHPSKVPTPVGGRPAAIANNDVPALPSFIYNKSPEAREMMVEALTGLTRMPSYFVDLYANYDCDVDRADLCEDLIGFLCRNAYPDSATWSTSSVPPLCLDALLSFLSSLVSRFETQLKQVDQKDQDLVSDSAKNKSLKKLVIEATDLFNEKPSKGIDMIVTKGLVSENSPAAILKFLRSSSRINKNILGQFVSSYKNKEYLDLFITSFDFQDETLDEALRDLCAAIRLPGESKLIERIMEKFSEHYCEYESNRKYVSTPTAAFILSYAVIMLNTDLHNPQVKSRMTREQFSRNLRDANDGKPFDQEYLSVIYDSIRDREIIMPEEHDNAETFDHLWRELILKSPMAGDSIICNSSIFDKALFESSWQPIVATLSYIFATATEDTVFSRVISGFNNISRIASHYKVDGVVDHVIYSLGKISTLSYGELSTPLSTVEMTLDDNEKITISDLSIHFGDNFKAQLASVVLFRIARSSSELVTDSWSQIISITGNLYLHSLLKPDFASDLHSKFNVPPLLPVKPAHILEKSKSSKDTSLFSALSSYLSGYSDSIPEPADEEIEATINAVECIESSRINEFLREALDSSPSKIVAGVITMPPPNLSGLSGPNRRKLYPTIHYLLDVATSAAINSGDHEAQKDVLGLIKNYVSEWEADDPDFLARCLICYVTLLRNANPELQTELEPSLEAIIGIKDVGLRPCMPQLIGPVMSLADDSSWCSNFVLKESSLYWEFFKIGASNRDSSQRVFQFVQDIIDKGNNSSSEATFLTRINIVHILDVLGEIVSMGACGAQLEQDKTAIAIEFRKQYDQQTAIRKAKEVIANMELDVNRASKVLDTLASIGPVVEMLADKPAEASQSWRDVWFPYVRTLSQQCINPSRRIRNHAFQIFQSACLSSFLQKHREDFDWKFMFEDELFPLLDTLLKAEVYETDPKGMSCTRLQSANLLCKVFLQYVVSKHPSSEAESSVTQSEELYDYWIRVLSTLDRLINVVGTSSSRPSTESARSSNQRDKHANNNTGRNSTDSNGETVAELEEGVTESIKNLLLVMNVSESPQDDKFWTETWKRVDAIIPGLKEDLMIKKVSSSSPTQDNKLSMSSDGSLVAVTEKDVEEALLTV